MPKFICFFILLFLTCWCVLVRAQTPAIEAIPNQPSPEAYDLLKDSKGYIWVGHDQGVSRYDGSTFITLHHPQQNSLSMTDLVEDEKGRIWCHNFSGQIFYIENLQLHLLKQYKFEEEQGYPRIIICGDELIATSVKGLFVYNLLTAKAVYHFIPDGTNSVTCVRNKVICYGTSGFHLYESGKPIKELTANLHIPVGQIGSLQPNSIRDTFFLIANPVGIYYKLTLEKNKVETRAENKMGLFINTVSVDGNKIWVNTKEYTSTIDGGESIRDMSLSDVITDNQKHHWMSSLKKGLCVQYNEYDLEKIGIPFSGVGTDIRKMQAGNSALFVSTTDGKLYQMNGQSSFDYVLSVPKKSGVIEQIASIGRDQLLIASSVGLYFYNCKTQVLRKLPFVITIKDIAISDNKVYLATIAGVKIFSFDQLASGSHFVEPEESFDKKNRCRSVAVIHDSVVVAYSDGVFIGYKNASQQLLFNQQPIYAAKIRTVSGRVLIGTYNQGLLIFENGKLRALTERDGLASNMIRDIKSMNGKTWLVYNDHFQLLNSSLTGVEDIAFPFSKIKSINDFALLNNRLYIATGDGIFTMPITKPVAAVSRTTYIDRIIVNGKDVITGSRLKYDQNYLQFQVSTPFYSSYSTVVYQYRFKNSPDSSWQRGSPGQTYFDVVALEPGIYDFEIVATDDNHNIISQPAVYHFEIEPPWYKRWTFRVGMLLLFAGFSFLAIRHYYQERLRKQRLEYQKILAVQSERQRISSEIHDDIGAGLSAIRLLTELTIHRLPEESMKQEVGKIHSSISELSNKMREVIWSLNTDNDKLENLLYYIRRQALLLFENSPIQLKVLFPQIEIPDLVISGEKRRHIYLAVKEALHNCLKHSEAQNCLLSIGLEDQTLHITIADDGKGFSPVPDDPSGNGLPGMKRRMEQMAGVFNVQSQKRTTVTFVIPLNEKHE